MKVCTMLVSCGILLAAVISAYSHPIDDVTTAKTTSVTSKDGTSFVPVPPPVSPLSTSASSFSATKPNLSGSLDSSESESKESEERKSSTTARSLFRRQTDDQPEDDGDDDGDDDSDGDDEADSAESRSRRHLPGSTDVEDGLSGQEKKPEDQKKDDQQAPEKVPPLATQPKY